MEYVWKRREAQETAIFNVIFDLAAVLLILLIFL